MTAARYDIGSPAYRRVTIALFLAGFVTFALLYATQPVLPQIAAEFAVTPGTAALSVSAATIGLGVGLLFAGPISEVRGRTPVMFLSLFASSVLGIACGLATSWPVLLVLRGIEGITLAGLPAVAMAYLSEEMTRGAQARAAGVYIGGTALGGMTARLLNAALTEHFGWHVALVSIGAAALASAVAARIILPHSRHFVPAPASVTHLLAQSRSLLRDPAMRALYGIAGCSMGAFVGVFNALSFRLQGEPYHLSVAAAGLVYLVYALGTASSTVAGQVVARRGQRFTAPYCALIFLAGVLLLLVTPLPGLLLGLAVVSTGFFALHGVASGWVAARATVGVGAPGQASSGYLFTYYAGSSLFGSLAGAALAWRGWAAVVALAATLVAVALLLTLRLRRIPSLLESDHPDPGVTGY